jgi:hypothetical protein
MQKEKPTLHWQTSAYERRAQFQFILPFPFLLVCKLIDVTLLQVLLDFMDNLSYSSWNRKGKAKTKEQLVAYFIDHGYGQVLPW